MGIDRKNILLFEEEGSSLIAVLIIITILSFLIGSVMIGTIIQNRFIQKDVNRLQARYTAEAGVFHFLGDTTLPLFPEIDSLRVQLMDSTQSAVLQIDPFGGFWKITSTAHTNNETKTVRALIGERASPVFQQAVVLGDLHSALNLTGSTNIEGDITVGPLGVRQRPFKGKLFDGSVRGEITQETEPALPPFDKTLFNYETTYCEALLDKAPVQAIKREAGQFNLSRENRLEEQDILYVVGSLEITASSEVVLPEAVTIVATEDLIIRGPVTYNAFSRFIAGGNLSLSGDIMGEHGLFYAAGDLIIDGREPFSGQFLSARDILISGRTYLKYPSVVYIKGATENGIRKGRLEVIGSSIVEGTMMIPAPGEVISQDESRLVVGEGATVRGSIYNTGQTELHGEIFGSVLTLQFYFYHSPTSYINWLKDASIDINRRPENFVVPLGFSDQRKFEILTWDEP